MDILYSYYRSSHQGFENWSAHCHCLSRYVKATADGSPPPALRLLGPDTSHHIPELASPKLSRDVNMAKSPKLRGPNGCRPFFGRSPAKSCAFDGSHRYCSARHQHLCMRPAFRQALGQLCSNSDAYCPNLSTIFPE